MIQIHNVNLVPIRYICDPTNIGLRLNFPSLSSRYGARSQGQQLQPSPHRKPGCTPHPSRPSPFDPGRRVDTEDPAWPSPPPSAANHQYVGESRPSSRQSLHPELAEPKPEPPRSKPLFRRFEKPSFCRIAILTVLCLITYPAFYILTLVAKDRSLFVVRAIVSVWCSGVGFALGYILLAIGAQYLEAASEFTLVRHRDFLILISNSLGDRDSHELRK